MARDALRLDGGLARTADGRAADPDCAECCGGDPGVRCCIPHLDGPTCGWQDEGPSVTAMWDFQVIDAVRRVGGFCRADAVGGSDSSHSGQVSSEPPAPGVCGINAGATFPIATSCGTATCRVRGGFVNTEDFLSGDPIITANFMVAVDPQMCEGFILPHKVFVDGFYDVLRDNLTVRYQGGACDLFDTSPCFSDPQHAESVEVLRGPSGCVVGAVFQWFVRWRPNDGSCPFDADVTFQGTLTVLAETIARCG